MRLALSFKTSFRDIGILKIERAITAYTHCVSRCAWRTRNLELVLPIDKQTSDETKKQRH
jgi:hypothetical protein